LSQQLRQIGAARSGFPRRGWHSQTLQRSGLVGTVGDSCWHRRQRNYQAAQADRSSGEKSLF